MLLQGKNVIVTGDDAGIGRAVCERLAAAGYAGFVLTSAQVPHLAEVK